MNELEARKKLLIAESELNRALLRKESLSFISEVHAVALQAKHLSIAASSVALIAAGFSAFKRKTPPPPPAKRMWFSTMLNGARIATSLWPIFRGRHEP